MMKSNFKIGLKIFTTVFHFVPFYVITSIIVIFTEASIVYLDLYLVEKLIELVQSNSTNFYDCLKFLMLILSISEIIKFFSFFQRSYIRMKSRHIWVKKIHKTLFSKAKQLDISYFDDPILYDKLSRALNQDVQSINAFDSIINMLKQIVESCVLIIYMLINAWLLFFIALFVSCFSFFLYSIVNKYDYQYWKDIEIDNRLFNYVRRTFYLEKYALDIKTTEIKELLYEKCITSINEIDKKYNKLKRKTMWILYLEDFVYQLINIFVVQIYLAYLLFFKGLSISKFVPLLNVSIQFNSKFYRLSHFFSSLNQSLKKLSDFIWLISYQDVIEQNTSEAFFIKDIVVKDVSFKYPNEENFSINKLNLSINKGEKIAIIGVNGAGKTTLTKLLLRLYKPESGQILVNGINYLEFTKKSIDDLYTTVLQNFQIYCSTIAENVLMRKIESETDVNSVIEALKSVGLYDKVSALPKGINTILTKEFSRDGLELSGGERQKLVISRIFASSSPIIILDEPTSAMDAISEKEIIDHIMNLCKEKNKTLVIISHRLSTIVNADKIYMMQKGEIIEEGNHTTLMNKKGKYFEMFMAQASLYNNKK